MAGLGYPTSSKSRMANRLGSQSPIGPQDVRNPNRVQFPGVDLRQGSGNVPAVSGRTKPVNVNGVLHGEILGPSGRPLDSSKAATVRGAVKALQIEGELGRPNSAKAKALRGLISKLLGPKAGMLLRLLGIVGLGLEFWGMFGKGTTGKGTWVHGNGDLCWSCTPANLTSDYGVWVEDLLTGPSSSCPTPVCSKVIRSEASGPYPTNPAGYPISSFGASATVSGYTMWRYSSLASPSTGNRQFQISARYQTHDPAAPLGPTWVGQAIPLPDFWPFPAQVLGPRTPRIPRVRVLNPPKPYQSPAIETVIVVKPGSGKGNTPPSKPVDTVHNWVPPGAGVKEKKRFPVSTRVLNIINEVTEGCDMVKALYDALPKGMTRWKGRDGKWRDQHITCHERALFVFRHALKVDLGDAIDNIVMNQIEDRNAGKLGQAKGATGRGLQPSRMGYNIWG